MADSNVAERLKTFIEKKGLTYSQFADGCGIPRPSLSQLLTGRNKKINDTMVGQIHKEFPELSVVWLLFGEGNMEVNEKTGSDSEIVSQNQSLNFSSDLFSFEEEDSPQGEKLFFSTNDTNSLKNGKENDVKLASNTGLRPDYKSTNLDSKVKELLSKIEYLKKNPRKVLQITVYYDDYTFETFVPGNPIK